jgi:hypothetical protein
MSDLDTHTNMHFSIRLVSKTKVQDKYDVYKGNNHVNYNVNDNQDCNMD